MSFNIDWAGAYQAWKQSGKSRRSFQYSPEFQAFLADQPMPSEYTVRDHFRAIRNQLEAKRILGGQRDDVEVSCNNPVQITRLSESDLEGVVGASKKKVNTQQHLYRVIVRLADGKSIEFESRNPELFAIKALCCNVEGL